MSLQKWLFCICSHTSALCTVATMCSKPHAPDPCSVFQHNQQVPATVLCQTGQCPSTFLWGLLFLYRNSLSCHNSLQNCQSAFRALTSKMVNWLMEARLCSLLHDVLYRPICTATQGRSNALEKKVRRVSPFKQCAYPHTLHHLLALLTPANCRPPGYAPSWPC